MYEVKAIVRLDRQEDVIAALHAVTDLPGLTVSIVEGVGRRHADAALESADYGRATMAKIEIVIGEDRLTQVLDAVTRGAHAAAAATARCSCRGSSRRCGCGPVRSI